MVEVKGDNQQPPQDLVVSEPRTIEFNLRYAHIPNGYPKGDRSRININEENEPSEDELKKFFTPEMISRLVYCPEINIDTTDTNGFFGYQPGYLFVCGLNYKGAKTLGDEAMLSGLSLKNTTTNSGAEITSIPHYDFFPKRKFIHQIITPRNTPKTYEFIRNLLENVNSEDVSTYQTDDLIRELKELNSKRETPDYFLKTAKEYRSDEKYRAKAEIFDEYAFGLEKKAEEIKKEIPEDTLKYLKITNVLQNRGINDSEILRITGCLYADNQKVVKQAIEQAKSNGNSELAQEISDAFNKVESLLKNNPRKGIENPDNQKLLSAGSK
jgi:hypothetical protein